MTAPAQALRPLSHDTDIASAAALIADPALRQSREATALAEARTCYDHLAGRAGVELLDSLLRRGLLHEEPLSRTDRDDTSAVRFEITGAGARALGSFGVNPLVTKSEPRPTPVGADREAGAGHALRSRSLSSVSMSM